MVRIRLRRMGAKKKPFYRIVVADKRSPRDGRFIETIGTYNPLTDPETVELKPERAAHWLSVGAQPSDAVARLLRKHSLLDDRGKFVPLAPVESTSEEATSGVVADAVPAAVATAEVVDEITADSDTAEENAIAEGV